MGTVHSWDHAEHRWRVQLETPDRKMVFFEGSKLHVSQARSCALYVALAKLDLYQDAMRSVGSYREIVEEFEGGRDKDAPGDRQGSLF